MRDLKLRLPIQVFVNRIVIAENRFPLFRTMLQGAAAP
jgi:hypothetical protein